MRAETRLRIADIQQHAEKILADGGETVAPILEAVADACHNHGRRKAEAAIKGLIADLDEQGL